VGYGNEQRFLGAQGEANYKSNFKNSVTFFSRLLGLRADYQDLKEETKWITSPIAVNDKGHLTHKIIY
jgi:molecular chaperone DnaK (HSP70)